MINYLELEKKESEEEKIVAPLSVLDDEVFEILKEEGIKNDFDYLIC